MKRAASVRPEPGSNSPSRSSPRCRAAEPHFITGTIEEPLPRSGEKSPRPAAADWNWCTVAHRPARGKLDETARTSWSPVWVDRGPAVWFDRRLESSSQSPALAFSSSVLLSRSAAEANLPAADTRSASTAALCERVLRATPPEVSNPSEPQCGPRGGGMRIQAAACLRNHRGQRILAVCRNLRVRSRRASASFPAAAAHIGHTAGHSPRRDGRDRWCDHH